MSEYCVNRFIKEPAGKSIKALIFNPLQLPRRGTVASASSLTLGLAAADCQLYEAEQSPPDMGS